METGHKPTSKKEGENNQKSKSNIDISKDSKFKKLDKASKKNKNKKKRQRRRDKAEKDVEETKNGQSKPDSL